MIKQGLFGWVAEPTDKIRVTIVDQPATAGYDPTKQGRRKCVQVLVNGVAIATVGHVQCHARTHVIDGDNFDLRF